MSFGAAGFGAQPFAGFLSGQGVTAAVVLPMLTGAGTAAVEVKGAGVATLPMMTGAGAGSAFIDPVGFLSLPMLTALAAVDIPVHAAILATMPMLTANATIATSTRRGLHSWQKCPRPASGFIERGGGDLRRGKPEPV